MLPREAMSNWKRFHELFSAAFIHEALGTAAELEVAEAVSESAEPFWEIARKLDVDAGALYRLLRALAAHGIFEEVKDGKFRHNSFSRQLLKSHPYSFQGMAKLWHSPPIRRAWGSFASAIRDGQAAFVHGNGEPIYQYLEKNPDDARLFHEAMENNSAVVAQAIAAGFSFGDYGSVVDLGGGVGTLLAAIVKQHGIPGAVYDLPVVADAARNYFGARGLGATAKFIGGDWFESVPEGYGVYVVKNSLWNWTDEPCARILENVARAMSPDSVFLIIEYLANAKDAAWSTAFDLQQLNVTGGRGRTADEYERLVEQAGMRVTASFQIENEQVLQCRKA